MPLPPWSRIHSTVFTESVSLPGALQVVDVRHRHRDQQDDDGDGDAAPDPLRTRRARRLRGARLLRRLGARACSRSRCSSTPDPRRSGAPDRRLVVGSAAGAATAAAIASAGSGATAAGARASADASGAHRVALVQRHRRGGVVEQIEVVVVPDRVAGRAVLVGQRVRAGAHPPRGPACGRARGSSPGGSARVLPAAGGWRREFSAPSDSATDHARARITGRGRPAPGSGPPGRARRRPRPGRARRRAPPRRPRRPCRRRW